MSGFPLSGLLRLRNLQEQIAAAAFADVNRALDRVHDQRARIRSEMAGAEPGTVSDRTLLALAMSRASFQSMLAGLAIMHETAAARTVATAHQTAKGQARGIEKLYERHQTTAAVEGLRAEQAALDEAAVTSWRRQDGRTTR
ncbi:hypothetical protein ATY41_09840 [Leifsonia xyli subsp. xyli]|uniref:Flagellar FliJ protein n=1 Tax=Leifsonia xyli subsp. xyli TaxID=59736 RepID=A0A1E2SL98_LEIXY|nr:hypothetical protein [Leifsonia xyli]ODA90533.1 hypothetical protein ATY41_09840 [Leifsonia xyli subsp. xyli]